MKASESLDFSSYSGRQLAFESIGASTWRALFSLHQSQLASGLLLQSYFEFKAKPLSLRSCGGQGCQEILKLYEKVEEDAAYLHRKDMERNALLGAIEIFDSFLSDALRFLFLHEPNAIPGKVPKEVGETNMDYLERVVRRYFSSQIKRLRFLGEKFKLKLGQESVADLVRLTDLRNEIVHHSSFYKFVTDSQGEVRAEDKPLPSVSSKDATKASMIVTEICDAVFVEMSMRIFKNYPKVRPLTPALSALFKQRRAEWAESEGRPPVIEEYLEPGWSVKTLSNPNLPWVGDDYYAFIVRATGLESYPVMIDFLWNKRHGTITLIAIDDCQLEELTSSQKLLDQMLVGTSMLVKFHDDRQDEPRYARFLLSGFASSWHSLLEKKAGSTTANKGGIT